MSNETEYYEDLLSRGYDSNHAIICTKEKYPNFSPNKKQDDGLPEMEPFDQGGTEEQNPYKPYLPEKGEESTAIAQLKQNSTVLVDKIRMRLETSKFRDVEVSRKTILIVSSVVGVLLLASILLLLARDAGGPVEGNWMNNQGQRFSFDEDGTANYGSSTNAMWNVDGSFLTIVVSVSETTYTHDYRISVSDDGKAMWMMPQSITNQNGEDYFDMPGYTPSCVLMLKSGLAPTLVEYIDHMPSYSNDTPAWCVDASEN